MSQATELPPSIKNILFVCYGNICRSPFCEYYWRSFDSNYQVASAGFLARLHRKIPMPFRVYGAKQGVYLSKHKARRITSEDIEWADLICLMDWQNYRDLEDEWPDALQKAVFLGQFAYPPVEELADPYHMTSKDADRLYFQVRKSVDGLYRYLREHRG